MTAPTEADGDAYWDVMQEVVASWWETSDFRPSEQREFAAMAAVRIAATRVLRQGLRELPDRWFESTRAHHHHRTRTAPRDLRVTRQPALARAIILLVLFDRRVPPQRQRCGPAISFLPRAEGRAPAVWLGRCNSPVRQAQSGLTRTGWALGRS